MMYAVVKDSSGIHILNSRDHNDDFIRSGAEGIVRKEGRELVALTTQAFRAELEAEKAYRAEQERARQERAEQERARQERAEQERLAQTQKT